MIHSSRQCSNASRSTTRPPERPAPSRQRERTTHPPLPRHSKGNPTMAERTVTIASKTGLHARPAGIFAKAAEQHTSELQSRGHLVCRLLLEKKNYYIFIYVT